MASLDDIIKLISKCSSFIISTHKYCDGDGLGAGTALHYCLKSIGKKSQMITLDTPHKKYDFLNADGIITEFDESTFMKSKPEVLIIVDANDHNLVEPLYSFAKKNNVQVCFIDHHPIIEHNKEDVMFINSEASSTAEIIHALLKKLNCSMNEKIATALLTSILFDTNQFRNIKNSASPFAISAEIVPHIKNVDLIYDSLFKNLTIDNLNFFETVKKVEYFDNKSTAFLYLTEKYIKEYKADINQAYNLMDTILDIVTIKNTALVVQNDDGTFKISLRSRQKNLIPLAQQFGGGGHKHSAGAYLKSGDIKDIKEKIISYFK